MTQAPLLSIRNLQTWFDEEERVVKAVDGVSISVARTTVDESTMRLGSEKRR